MSVTTATYDSVEATWIYKRCLITVGDCTFVIELIFLSIKNMDLVFGMEWLSANAAYIACKEKAIYIPKESVTPKEVILELSKCTINMIPYLYSKDRSFLLLFTMDSEGGNVMSLVPIVREFPYVFPEDVTTLPLERKIEFSIDLVPVTVSVSIAPYRMSPTKLRELKMQLEKLLENNFIRHGVCRTLNFVNPSYLF